MSFIKYSAFFATIVTFSVQLNASATSGSRTVVWKKTLGNKLQLSVERLEIKDAEASSGLGKTVNFEFILIEDGNVVRDTIWTRPVWFSSVSAPSRSPEVVMLDAAIAVNGDVSVIFNQYGLCWAFRIKRSKDIKQGENRVKPDDNTLETARIDQPDATVTTQNAISVEVEKGRLISLENDELSVETEDRNGSTCRYKLHHTQQYGNSWKRIP